MKNLFWFMVMLVLGCGLALGQTYKVLWSFGGAPNDGANPVGNLVFDSAGNLYGTTQWGGNVTNSHCFGAGCGTVFELSPNPDGTWTNTVLYSFCANYAAGSCLDGQEPVAGLSMDAEGNLYGTTYNGGAVYCPSASAGCGTVFELSPPASPGGAWTETVVHSFCANYVNGRCLDGEFPSGHLTFDTAGNLYGTTSSGGSGAWLGGTVFELSLTAGAWTETVLYNFCVNGVYFHCSDGSGPLAGVTFDKSGNLYGTTQVGGTPKGDGGGTVYSLTPGSNGWVETTLVAFHQGDNELRTPESVVSFDSKGNLYSTAYNGGPANLGGVFRFNPNSGITRALLFSSNSGGVKPSAGVLVDQKTSAVYGTTTAGWIGGGTVYKVTQSGEETVIYAFCQQENCADGEAPAASLTLHEGKLFGTTEAGGASGFGVVYEIAP
jgi:uncharacterized repeat protein (TIGR03803 family)